MKITKKRLQQLISEEVNKLLLFLSEKAKTTASARSEKLALFVLEKNTMFVLLNAQAALDNMLEVQEERLHGFSADGKHLISPYIVAYIRVESQPGAYGTKAISLAAAENKYGPLLYDIVMSRFKGLTPDREEVSSDAEKVWTYYSQNRSDVKKLPLDNADNPKTKTKKDDSVFHGSPETAENPLNQAYFMKNPKSSKSLESNAVKFQQTAIKILSHKLGTNKTQSKKLLHSMFLFAVDDFFGDKYWGR